MRGSADYWAHCGGATEHGISTANRFRPLKREQLLEELRAHLGLETQRQWSDRAIARTTPALSGLFSVVTLAVDVLVGQQGGMAPRATAWYDKTSPSFADAIALVRRYLWVERVTFMTSEREPESIKVPRLLYHRMLDTLAYAA